MTDRAFLAKVLDLARAQGWRVHFGRHWRLYPADPAQPPVTMATSPSDWRWQRNKRAELRRRGLRL